MFVECGGVIGEELESFGLVGYDDFELCGGCYYCNFGSWVWCLGKFRKYC